MRAAAKVADKAVARTVRKYSSGQVTDEDDLTGVLVGNLDAAFDGAIGDIVWSSSILRHRKGQAAEEKRIGADILIHVELDTPTDKYSKGVLIQSKRVRPQGWMTSKEHKDLKDQCRKMLSLTAASFVMNYTTEEFRCGSASRLMGATDRDIHAQCSWTSYRFFLELFRCPIGDPRISSALVKDLPVDFVVEISGEGELDAFDFGK